MQKVNLRSITLLILTIFIITIIALLISSITYSYLTPVIDADETNDGEVNVGPSDDTLIFYKGDDLTLSATSSNFTTGGGNLTASSNPKVRLIPTINTTVTSATYNLGISISANSYQYTNDSNAEIILTILDENADEVTECSSLNYTSVTDGQGNTITGFDITGLTGTYTILENHSISTTTSSGTTHTFTVTLTFVNYGSETGPVDQSANENATLTMEIILQRESIV